jgi:hypothetical protein
MQSANATSQILAGVNAINQYILPAISTNRSACRALLSYKEAENNRQLRDNLEFAAVSCALVIKAHERLVDVANKIADNNVSCPAYVTPALVESSQYDVQTSVNYRTVSSIVLASLGLVLGLILLVFPPLKGSGTMGIFIISASYRLEVPGGVTITQFI